MEKQASRTYKVMRNSAAGVVGSVVSLVLRFVERTVFVYTLSQAYAGIGSLYGSILAMLSLAELGMGSAITFALYKPLAVDDHEKIKTLMQLYKRAYRVIGLVVLGVGLALLPALPKLMNGTTDLVNIQLVYILYLLKSAVSYLLFAYKSALLGADQKSYIMSLYSMVIQMSTSVLMIVVLLLLKRTPALSFYAYLCVGMVTGIIQNIIVAGKVDKLYPYLKDKNVTPLHPEERKVLTKNVTGLFMSKISGAALAATDNVITQLTVSGGLILIGIYSNYLHIMSSVSSLLNVIFNALTPSIGNLLVHKEPAQIKPVYESINLMFFWIVGFASVCYWNLFNSFIAGVWINSDWLLSDTAVFLIVLSSCIDGLMGAVIRFRDAAGLFWQVKWRYLASAILNIGLSYLFAAPLGMGFEGVLLATVICRMFALTVDPRIVFERVFHENPWKFYRQYLFRLALVLGTGGVIRLICSPLPTDTVWGFLIRLAVCLVLPNGLWYLIFRKTPEFGALLLRIRAAIAKIKDKVLARRRGGNAAA